MQSFPWIKNILIFLIITLTGSVAFANDDLFVQARELQRDGKYDEAIKAFKGYLLQPIDTKSLSKEQLITYTDALMQLMNTFQSKGEPEACVTTMQEIYKLSPVLQRTCLRDYYSVMGYALSRTVRMKDAEETMLKAFTIPLQHATPERYFRDYAYAAAVFYSNPEYQEDVIEWCQEAMKQAELCENTSGKQWVAAMLGSLYKRNGRISQALELFQQSKEEAHERGDHLGVLNSLHALIDLFLYWDVPEYANIYASEAIQVEQTMTMDNPMVSAQTYINKGRALQQLGLLDSVSFYTLKARGLCSSLPYNSGMVDVDLLHGTFLTEMGGDSLHLGIQELEQVTHQATSINRAKAYHQLAQTYLKQEMPQLADIMLDSLYSLIKQSQSSIYIHLNYQPILDHYLKNKNHLKAEQFTRLMLNEQEAIEDMRLNFNLVEAIAEMQSAKQKEELRIVQLEQTNQHLWYSICAILSITIILVIVALLFYQRKQHKIRIKQADDKLADVVEQLNQTSAEKDMMSQEIDQIMSDKDSRQELETLTPSLLMKQGESKFRQRFELLYPLFLPRLRERVPSITRREELLSMLIVLKQDNKEIADLLSIAPRSVLMLRHRFRQKIGMTTDNSLEEYIDEILGVQNASAAVTQDESESSQVVDSDTKDNNPSM